ncbi:nucleoside deaminase [Planctellipticum variicoloris]|uniref:nucleoside deaminase n=1 Tax=Planctellipticum variicoloris TaxID=3064265 RepID=UPI0030137415|nr:nucleoside deaminase [Planctomycetaceae bacterium SH412]
MDEFDELMVAMRRALAVARLGMASGQTPFGSVILQNGRVLAEAHNTVWRDTDPTAHAEINAIRLAARVSRKIDLSGAILLSTCEPCPMCLSAIHWARIDRVVFGATIDDAAAAGFHELRVGARELAELGRSPLVVQGPVLVDECRTLFDEWQRLESRRVY